MDNPKQIFALCSFVISFSVLQGQCPHAFQHSENVQGLCSPDVSSNELFYSDSVFCVTCRRARLGQQRSIDQVVPELFRPVINKDRAVVPTFRSLPPALNQSVPSSPVFKLTSPDAIARSRRQQQPQRQPRRRQLQRQRRNVRQTSASTAAGNQRVVPQNSSNPSPLIPASQLRGGRPPTPTAGPALEASAFTISHFGVNCSV